MTAIGSWTGREARALRQALRLSVRAFAEHLDIAARTVSKWEKLGEATRPYPDQQALLDTALDRAGSAAQERFILLLNGSTTPAVRSPAVPASWDYESWDRRPRPRGRRAVSPGLRRHRQAAGTLAVPVPGRRPGQPRPVPARPVPGPARRLPP
jgi:transcriptional regulator with XRE-family HTH domain